MLKLGIMSSCVFTSYHSLPGLEGEREGEGIEWNLYYIMGPVSIDRGGLISVSLHQIKLPLK